MVGSPKIENRAILMNDPQQVNNQGMIPSADSESLSRTISPPTYILDSPPNSSHDPESSDSSWPLFSLYLEKTEEEGDKLAELYTKDVKSIIILVRISVLFSSQFSHIMSLLQTGLFSAVIAPLLAVTILDLKQNPQERSNFYLENMYKLQFLAGSNASLPPTPAEPPPFSPPKYVIWVNSLWSLSLCVSLSCAVLAILLQQWARLYLRNTRSQRYSPHERARIRAFLANGVDNSGLSWVVEVLPFMIHFSLFLFFAGLVLYLFNANHSVFIPVVCWVGFSGMAYFAISFMPVRRLDSPFRTPLTSMANIWGDTEKRVEEFVKGSSAKMDRRILNWLFGALIKDSDRLRLLECIPGFCRSSVVNEDLFSVTNSDSDQSLLSSTLWRILLATWWTYTSVSDERRRFAVLAKVADTVRLPYVAYRLTDAAFSDQYEVQGLRPIEIGQSLMSRDGSAQKDIGLCTQCVVARIISTVHEHDEGWIGLAADQLGKSKGVIKGYLECGSDNVLLANLIHLTRQIIHDSTLGDGLSRDIAEDLTRIIPSDSDFDIQNTLPGLQHDFLALWDEIDQDERDKDETDQDKTDRDANSVLKNIRDSLLDLYNTLTHGIVDTPTAPPTPDINLPGHPSDSIYVIDDSVDENSHRHTTTPPPISHPNPGLATFAPTLSPVLAHTTADPTDESLPGDPPYVTQPITQVTLSPQSAPDPLESDVVSDDPQGVVFPVTATPGNISDNSSRDQSTLNPRGVPSVNSPASTSAPSPPPAAAQLSFVLDSISSTVPLGAHDDDHDLNDSTQMGLSHETGQLGPSDSPA
jgi:Family of unknown function (DUF6535)